MSLNVVTLLYLVASVCFIQALKGLSNPKTARIGNTFGMAGMAIAILTTLALIVKQARLSRLESGARAWRSVRGADHRRRGGRVYRGESRDDEDAGTRRGDALADRSCGGVYRVCGGCGAVRVRARRRPAIRFRMAIASSCSSARSSARSRSRVRSSRSASSRASTSSGLFQGRAGRVSGPASDQPAARHRDDRLRHHLHAHAVVAAVRAS